MPVESLTPPTRQHARLQPREPLTMLLVFKSCIEARNLPTPGDEIHARLIDVIADLEDP
jgi:hypothetical protein